jgi:phenylalanine-4-hydroxylase
MSLRTGGLKGVQKLIESKNLGSIKLSTGIQISGVFTKVITDENDNPIYVQTNGPTALARGEKELIGHGVDNHSDGFGSPIGKLKGINLAIEDMFPKDLEVYGIYEGKKTTLLFEGNIKVEGEVITGKRDLKGKILLISFKNCSVTHNDTVLFKPEWGIYDMAVGKEIVSAYAGPASVNSFKEVGKVSKEKTHKIAYAKHELILHELYSVVANIRKKNTINIEELASILAMLKSNYSKDWLLPLEIYELVYGSNTKLEAEVLKYLMQLKKIEKYKQLIDNGLKLIEKK